MTQNPNRRSFFQISAAALAFASNPSESFSAPEEYSGQAASAVPANEGKKPLRLGLILGVGRDPESAIARLRDLGLPTCQVYLADPDLAPRLRSALDKNSIEATSLVVGGPGREVWDFYEGPLTIGLVP